MFCMDPHDIAVRQHFGMFVILYYSNRIVNLFSNLHVRWEKVTSGNVKMTCVSQKQREQIK